MSAVRPDPNQYSVAIPSLLVELPSWPRTFVENLQSLVVPDHLPPLNLRSAPAAFWSDVFVRRHLPWDAFTKSYLGHMAAVALILGFSRLLALQPHAEPRPAFDHAQILYYSPSEYLPPIDTRQSDPAPARKADPEFSRQTIISVPSAPDNRRQTIVTPPKVRLNEDAALPNIVAWSDKAQKPQLEIPPAPLIAAAEIQRIAPQLTSVVTPPPQVKQDIRRERPDLRANVVAPPPRDLARTQSAVALTRTPNMVIAPPPSFAVASNRPIGDLNIAPSAIIAPAPSLPVAAQRTLAGSGMLGSSPAVVPPPPSVASGAGGASFGAPGRMIALNLHPAIGAPADPPMGNRRGSFAATPEGHAGATGNPGSSSGKNSAGGKGSGGATDGSGSTGSRTSDLPAGLYIGPHAANSAPVSGNATGASASSVNPNLLASIRPPRVTTAGKPMQPDSSAKLSEAERAVFGSRRFYSVTLSMPNLNSAGGSWVIRFAELNRDPNNGSKPADLSEPMATRKVDPAYPTQLMRQNVAGTVILYAVIHADGSVGDVRVLRGVDERLDRFAVEAVSQWKFDPATKAGVPVDVEATFRIPFRPAMNF